MRRRFRMTSALALGTAAVLSTAMFHQASAQTMPIGGDFIVRCFFNNNVAAMDPILDPRVTPTEHMHIFFGNLVQGTASFPSIASGDGGNTGTMETGSDGNPQPTNCQDKFDTAGYWQPEPYLGGSPYLGPTQTGCMTTTGCDPGTIMHLRVYYLPNALTSAGSQTQQEIPDGSIMVAGFPNGCRPQANAPQAPPGCASSSAYPVDLNIVRYDCGANNNVLKDKNGNEIGVVTPESAWPYDCNPYVTDNDDSFNDGIVAFTDFPDCWNGNKDWTAPNNPNGKVAGYVAPWIADPSAPTNPSTGARLNDFTYTAPGTPCPSDYPIAVVQLEERFHLLTMGTNFGAPSTCSNQGGTVGWNDPAKNAEFQDGGPMPNPCTAASSPSSHISLSFGCNPATSGGDSNCSVDTRQPGCATSNGDCFIGMNPVGWETLHADYWQTWREGGGNQQGVGTDVSGPPDPTQGSFRDLIEDCSNEIPPSGSSAACSFINTATQTPGNNRVFYTGSENS